MTSTLELASEPLKQLLDKVWVVFRVIGEKGQMLPVHTFDYVPPTRPTGAQSNRSRIVTHADGSRTEYLFNRAILPIETRWYDETGTLRKQKRRTWNAEQRLVSFEVLDGSGQSIYTKHFEYDEFGNPTATTYSGDITGSGDIDTTTVRRAFSSDGRHLLLREEDETGKVLCFQYLPDTNLLTRRLVQKGTTIVKREFRQYDDCHNLVCTIIDDGATDDSNDLDGVTQRTLKRITLRQQQPFLHMPEREEEYYFSEGQEKLLKGSRFEYDERGNVCLIEVYDQEQTLYTLKKTYDERGNVLSETNALGAIATYSYDNLGRTTSCKEFSGQLETEYSYDACGCITQKRESEAGGTQRNTIFTYDALGRCISKTDYLGHVTRYAYDPVCGKVTRTEEPPVVQFDGSLQEVITQSFYDAMGRKVKEIDANGGTALYDYNIFGSPTCVQYPDGQKETYQYTKEGLLECHTDRQGLSIKSRRDLFGRITEKTFVAANGKILGKESTYYTAFHKVSEVNREGEITSYLHDGAGRVVKEEHAGRVTRWSYNAQGEVIRTVEENGSNTLLIHFKRDALGRVLLTTKSNLQGIVLYKLLLDYDLQGNVIGRTRYIQGDSCREWWSFNGFGEELLYTDAKGQQTRTFYQNVASDVLGYQQLQRLCIKPDGVTTKETFDAMDRVVTKELFSSAGVRLKGIDWYFDPMGNPLQRDDHIFIDGLYQNTQSVRFTYTKMHKVATTTRAYGTPDARCTSYTYRPSGQKSTQTKPDGTTIYYSYDGLGYLTAMRTPDARLQLAFTHDKLGHLLSAKDERNGTWVERQLSPHGEVLKETWNHGQSVERTYDQQGRLVTLMIPGMARTDYNYDALYLRSVDFTRLKDGAACVHTYADYDQDGNLLEEIFPMGAGSVAYNYESNGYVQSKLGDVFQQECAYDCNTQLVHSLIDDSEFTYGYDDLGQLAEESSPYFSKSYQYDSNFNRVASGEVVCEVNDLNEQLSDDRGTYTYDTNGNISNRCVDGMLWTFTYDPLDRMQSATSDGLRLEMQYDPKGRRISKTTLHWLGGEWIELGVENYLYHEENDLAAIDSNGQVLQLRALGLAKHTNFPNTIAMEVQEKLYVPLLDCHGNMRRLWDPVSKVVTESYEFSSFGHEVQPTAEQSYLNPWRYASKRIDPETGLVYFSKRYYDPQMGRWFTTDPAGFVDGTNLYTYLLNSPFAYIDPDGRFAFAIPLLYWGGSAGLTFALPTLSQILFGALTVGIIHQTCQMVDNSSLWYVMDKLPFPGFPDDMAAGSEWTEITHPEARKKGHRRFQNNETGEIVRWDDAKPGESGNKGRDHYHWENPNSTGRKDKYLDADGEPCAKNSDESHLYAPEGADPSNKGS